MDPTRCMFEILSDLNSGDIGSAGRRAEDLIDWIRKGGFPPDVFNDKVAIEDRRRTTRLFCLGVIAVFKGLTVLGVPT